MRRKPPKADDTSPALMNVRAELLALQADAVELEKTAIAHHAAGADLLAHVKRHTKATAALVAELQPAAAPPATRGVDDVAG